MERGQKLSEPCSSSGPFLAVQPLLILLRYVIMNITHSDILKDEPGNTSLRKGRAAPQAEHGHFRSGCDAPPARFLQTRSCTLCPSNSIFLIVSFYKEQGLKDASLQKLLGLQRWPCHRLGDCSNTHTDNQGQRGHADHPIGLFRLLYRLGVDDDCPIRLSAGKALGVEPPGITSSSNLSCGPFADDMQLTPGLLALIFLRKSWPKVLSSTLFRANTMRKYRRDPIYRVRQFIDRLGTRLLLLDPRFVCIHANEALFLTKQRHGDKSLDAINRVPTVWQLHISAHASHRLLTFQSNCQLAPGKRPC